MSEQPLQRKSVRATVKWAKSVAKNGDGKPSRAMRRAQGRILQALAEEAAAPIEAVNDAVMIVLFGETGSCNPEQMRRLARPDRASSFIDAVVALLTPPASTDESFDSACQAFCDHLGAKPNTWAAHRAALRMQLSVWHHTGIDPSAVVASLLQSVTEDGPPKDPAAALRAAIDQLIQSTHDAFAADALRKHGGSPEAVAEGLGLAPDSDLRLRTGIVPVDVPELERGREPPRKGDVVEPAAMVVGFMPTLEGDVGDVLEHQSAEDAPAGVACAKVRWRRNAMDTLVEDDLLQTVMRCTCHKLEPPDPRLAECIACGSRDCPTGEPFHYHHDGCPDCTMEPPEHGPN